LTESALKLVAASFWFARAKRRWQDHTIGVLTTRGSTHERIAAIGGVRCYERSVGSNVRSACTASDNLDRSLTAPKTFSSTQSISESRNTNAKNTRTNCWKDFSWLAGRRKDDRISGGMASATENRRALMHTPSILFLDDRPLVWIHNRAARCGSALGTARKRSDNIFDDSLYGRSRPVMQRIAIVDHGKMLALDTPGKLKTSVPAAI